MTSKNKIIKFAVVALIAAAIGKFAGYAIYDAKKKQEQTEKRIALQKVLQTVTDQTNKGLPAVINQSTRLDRVMSDSEIMNLNHTILDAEEWSKADSEKLSLDLPKRVCGDESMKALLAMGATVIYSYNDKLGRPLFLIPIQLADCK